MSRPLKTLHPRGRRSILQSPVCVKTRGKKGTQWGTQKGILCCNWCLPCSTGCWGGSGYYNPKGETLAWNRKMELLLLSTSSMQEANPTWKCLHKHSPERSVKDSVLLPQTLKKHRSGPRDRSIFFFSRNISALEKLSWSLPFPLSRLMARSPLGGLREGQRGRWLDGGLERTLK